MDSQLDPLGLYPSDSLLDDNDPLGIYTPEKPPEKSLGIGGTLKQIGKQLLDVPEHLAGAAAATYQNEDVPVGIDAENSISEKLIQNSRDLTAERAAELPRDTPTAIPGLNAGDIQSLGQSLGFSGVGIAAGFGAGIPASIASPFAGYAAGGVASGVAADRMSKNQFLHDLRAKSEQDIGRPLTDSEFGAIKAKNEEETSTYGKAEAIPEAIGNVIDLAILVAPGGGWGKTIVTRAFKKLASMYGTELATETVTQQIQQRQESIAGLTPEQQRSYGDLSDWWDSFKEIAAQTVLQTTLIGGAGAVGSHLYDKANPPPPAVIPPSVALGIDPNDGVISRVAATSVDEQVPPDEPPPPPADGGYSYPETDAEGNPYRIFVSGESTDAGEIRDPFHPDRVYPPSVDTTGTTSIGGQDGTTGQTPTPELGTGSTSGEIDNTGRSGVPVVLEPEVPTTSGNEAGSGKLGTPVEQGGAVSNDGASNAPLGTGTTTGGGAGTLTGGATTPATPETQTNLDREIENLRQILEISKRQGLSFDIQGMASDALKNSGRLNEVLTQPEVQPPAPETPAATGAGTIAGGATAPEETTTTPEPAETPTDEATPEEAASIYTPWSKKSVVMPKNREIGFTKIGSKLPQFRPATDMGDNTKAWTNGHLIVLGNDHLFKNAKVAGDVVAKEAVTKLVERAADLKHKVTPVASFDSGDTPVIAFDATSLNENRLAVNAHYFNLMHTAFPNAEFMIEDPKPAKDFSQVRVVQDGKTVGLVMSIIVGKHDIPQSVIDQGKAPVEEPKAEAKPKAEPKPETTGKGGGTITGGNAKPEVTEPKVAKPKKEPKPEKEVEEEEPVVTNALSAIENGDIEWLRDNIYEGVFTPEEITDDMLPIVFPDDHMVRISLPYTEKEEQSKVMAVEKNLKKLHMRVTDRTQEAEGQGQIALTVLASKAKGIGDVGEVLGGKVKDQKPPTVAAGTPEEEALKLMEKWLDTLHKKNFLDPEANAEQTFGNMMYKEAIYHKMRYPLAYLAKMARKVGSYSRGDSDKQVLLKAFMDADNVGSREILTKYAESYVAEMTKLQALLTPLKTVREVHSALHNTYFIADRDDAEFAPTAGAFMNMIESERYNVASDFNNYIESYRELFSSDEESTDQTHRVVKKDPNIAPRIAYIVRKGMKSHRNGKDVSDTDFMDTFGFKGAEFGNWATQEERQQNLNYAYDSLYDMADTLGMSPKLIGQNNNLGMAIGARGSKNPRAAAHFEPGSNVINLTKTKGDGTVGHEWFHGLDHNFIGLAQAAPDDGISTAPFLSDTRIRTFIEHLTKTLSTRIDPARLDTYMRGLLRDSSDDKSRTTPPKDALFDRIRAAGRRSTKIAEYVEQQTDFRRHARELDSGSQKNYWSTPEEMLARGYESYLYDTTKGGSPYLVGYSRAAGYMSPKNGYKGIPYPLKDEREYFQTQYQNFFDNLDKKTYAPIPYKVKPKVLHIEDLGYTVIDQNDVGSSFSDSSFGALEWFVKEEDANTHAESLKGSERYLSPLIIQHAKANRVVLDFANNVDKIMEEMGLIRWPEIKDGSMVESMFFHLKQGWWPADNRQLKEYAAKAYRVPIAEVELIKQKQMQEDFEAALVRYANHLNTDMILTGSDSKTVYDKMASLYQKQPLLQKQSSISAANQAFSTPVPIAHIVGLLSRIKPTSSVFDPTGGNGALFITANSKKTTAIELDNHRALNMRLMDVNKVIEGDTLKVMDEVHDNVMDAVVINPPFGALTSQVAVKSWDGRDFMLGKLDHLIAARALSKMYDKGRAVILLGANKKVGALSSTDRVFLNWITSNYNVTDHFEIDGQMYKRQGAEWPIRVLVISGRLQTEKMYDSTKQVDRVFDYEQLWSRYVQASTNSETVLVGAGEKTSTTGSGDNLSGGLPSGDTVEAGNADRERGNGVGNKVGSNDTDGSGIIGTGSESTDVLGESSGLHHGSTGRLGGSSLRRPGQRETSGQANGGVSGSGTSPTDPIGLADLELSDIADVFDDVFNEPTVAPTSKNPKAKSGSSGTPSGTATPRAKKSTGDPDLDAIFSEMDRAVNRPRRKTQQATLKAVKPTPPYFAKKNLALIAYKPPLLLTFKPDHLLNLEKEGFDISILENPMFSRSPDPSNDKIYEEYQPFFDRIMEALRTKFENVMEQIREFARVVKQRYGDTIKPYAMRYINAILEAAKVTPSSKKPIVTAPVDTEKQVAYISRSRGENNSIYIPRPQAEALYRALDRFEAEHGDVDEYVMEKLGYESIEAMFHDSKGVTRLGAYQIDALALAIAQMENGDGFIIGDATGVGKGRTAAALMAWAINSGKIPVFMTYNDGLFSNMYEDLLDIGMLDKVKIAMTNTTAEIKAPDESVVLKGTPEKAKALYKYMIDNNALPDGANALFTNYSQFNDPKTSATRMRALEQLVVSGKAMFIMDESHSAAGDSNTGNYMQSVLTGRGLFGVDSDGEPNPPPDDWKPPPITYLSATFAKRPDNMPIYMRTHLAKAGDTPEDIVTAFQGGGDILQQIASEMLVNSGSMIRRERSYEGVKFGFLFDKTNEERDIRQVDEVTDVLRSIVRADRAFHEWTESTAGRAVLLAMMPPGYGVMDKNGNMISSAAHHKFTSVVHNYVGQLLLATKIDSVVKYAVDLINNGEKVVFSLHNTMEAALKDYVAKAGVKVGDELTNFGWQSILTRGLDTSHTVTYTSPTGRKADNIKKTIPLSVLPIEIQSEFQRGIEKIAKFQSDLPAAPIDMLRHRMSQYFVVTGADGKQSMTLTPPEGSNSRPFVISEITNRDLGVDYSTKIPKLTRRKDPKSVDVVREYGSGGIDALIINSAGSTGVNAHASVKFKDQRPRHMIVLQPSADITVFIQSIGRINRNGQVEWPSYTIYSSSVPAERRILAVLKKKLKALYSNTSSGKGATEIEAIDFINRYGDIIVAGFLNENKDMADFVDISIPPHPEGTDFASKATGQAALLPSDEQKDFFDVVEDRYTQLMEARRLAGLPGLEMEEKDYQADAINTFFVEEGADEGNPFSESVYMNEMEINIIGDIPTPDTVRAARDAALNGRTPEVVVDELDNSLQAQYIAGSDALTKRLETYNAELLNPELTASDITAANLRISNVTTQIAEFNFRRKATVDALNDRFPIGALFNTVNIGDVESSAMVVGYSVGKVRGTTSNPFSPSNIRIVLQRNLPAGRITLALSEIESGANGVSIPYYQDRWANIDTMFAMKSAIGGRTKRYIVTGNLVRYRVLSGSGEFIKFTMAGSTPENKIVVKGIEMPHNFRIDPNLKSLYAIRNKKAAAEYLLGLGRDIANVLIEKETYESDKERHIAKRDEFGSTLKFKHVAPDDLISLAKDEENILSSANGSIAFRFDYAGNLNLRLNTSFDKKLYKSKAIINAMGGLYKDKGRPWASGRIKNSADLRKTLDVLYMKGNLSVPEVATEHTRGIVESYRENQAPAMSLSGKTGKAMSVTAINQTVESISAKWKNAPKIVVVHDMQDSAIPEAVRDVNQQQLSQGATGTPEGFYYKGTVYVVSSKMFSPSDIVRVVLHESLGHYGLRGVFGKELNNILKQIILLRKNDVLAKAKSYGLDINSESGMMQAAEELLAEMAQTNPKLGFVKRAIAAIRSWIRKTFPFSKLYLSDAEIIRDYLIPARNFVREGAGTPSETDTNFSRAGESAPFYSALTSAVGATTQQKAAGFQWQGIIKNMKGVKPDEIFWTGVNKWLGEQKGTVTKAELMDYLHANEVTVKEVTLGGTAEQAPTSYEELNPAMQKLVDQFDTDKIDERQLQDKAWEQGYKISLNLDGTLEHIVKLGQDDYDQRLTEIAHQRRIADSAAMDARRPTPASRPTQPRTYSSVEAWIADQPWKEAWRARGADYNEALRLYDEWKSREPEIKTPAFVAKQTEEHQRLVEQSNKLAAEYADVHNKMVLAEIKSVQPTIFHDPKYRLPGGTDYRETIVMLPIKEGEELPDGFRVYRDERDTWAIELPNGTRISGWSSREDAIRSQGFQPGQHGFKSNHFPDQPNPVVHIRHDVIDGADGKKYLRISEIQSDWGQRGKRGGFDTEGTKEKFMKWAVDNGHLHSKMPEIQDMFVNEHFGVDYDSYYRQYLQEIGASTENVPSAPFVTKTESWVGLAIKTMVRYAAEHNLDGVVFVNGEQAAGFYDLSKQISSIRYNKIDAKVTGGADKYGVVAIGKAGVGIGNGIVMERTVSGKELPEIVGKEIAQKIINGEGTAKKTELNNGDVIDTKEFSGLDLKVGGEGMKAFYDKIVPNVANNVLKSLGGGKVEPVDFKGEQYNSLHEDKNKGKFVKDGHIVEPQLGFTLTPEMKRMALAGQPLFSRNDQTQSPEFKKWFGDSEVIDANGKPLMVYHGSRADITQFISPEARSGEPYSQSGIYFTEDTGLADIYASPARLGGEKETGGVYPVYLSIKNPLDLTRKFQIDTTLKKIVASFLKNIIDRETKLVAGVTQSLIDKETREKIQAAGYDGIRGEGGVWIAFEPTQIKSAIGNSGAFDANNPDIRFSRSALGINQALIDESKVRAEKVTDALIYNYQDKFVDLKNFQKQSPPSEESADPYLAAEIYPSKVKAITDDFHDDSVNPLIKAIHDAKLDYDEVQEYLHAKHAPSRNAEMQKRNPTQDELDAMRQELSDTRDSLAGNAGVTKYLALRRKLAKAKNDVEDGIADETQVDILDEEISKLRTENADVNNYLSAIEQLSALRNIKPYDGDNTALSGMSNDEAAEIIDRARSDGKYNALENIASSVNEITNGTRESLLRSGLITQSESDMWESLWENYVPLHRDEVSEAMPRIGQGFNVRGKESRHATGSTKEVTNILAHVMAQREAAIIRGEKVKVDRAMAKYVRENPDDSLWELDVAPMVNDLDKTTGLVVRRVDPTYKNKDNVLTYKVGGREHTITFNEKNVEAMRLVASLKNMSAAELGEVTILVGKVTRFLATMNTSANPVFVARNFLRDIQTAFVNLSDTELHGMKKEVFKNIHNAIRGMWKMSRGDMTSMWATRAREFRDAGGQIGYTDYYKDISARAENLKGQLEGMGDGKWNLTKRQATAYWNLIEDANIAVENGVRLAAFVAARNAGMSTAKAASLAKNLTVNFNRHGAKGVELNMWYMFMNASIQGTARLFQALKNKNVQKIIGGVVASGFLLDILARSLAGDDDDDGENDYDQLPEYIKQKNFVFWVNGKPVTIPMPYGYNFFSNVGRKMSQSMFQENYSPAKGAVELFTVAFDAFSPTGQSGSLLQLAAPTIADPFVQWAENKNFAGNPMRKEQSPFGLPKPEYQMGFKSASAPSKVIAEELNMATGGNQVRPGWLNMNPALFDFAITSVFGGAGRTYLQAVSLPIKLAQDDEIQAREVPFANIFLSANPENQVERKFFDALQAVETVQEERKLYAGDRDKVAQLREEHGAEMKMVLRAKFTSAQLRKLRQRELKLQESNLPNKKELLKQNDERQNKMMADFNKSYAAMQ